MDKLFAVAVAMKSEAQPLLGKMTDVEYENYYGFEFYTGQLNGKRILVGVSGVGMVNMGTMTFAMCEKYDVSAVMNYGIIGGYGENIHKGDLLVVTDSVHINSYRRDSAEKGEDISLSRNRLMTFSEGLDDGIVRYATDNDYLEKIKNITGDRAIYGTVGSGDVWNREYDKIMLFHTQYDVCGEDMECYRMYQNAHRLGIPCMSVKGVSNNEILKESYDYSVMENLVDRVCEIIDIIA